MSPSSGPILASSHPSSLPSPLPSSQHSLPIPPLPPGAATPYANPFTPAVPMERTPRSPPSPRTPPPPPAKAAGRKPPPPPPPPMRKARPSLGEATSVSAARGNGEGQAASKEDGASSSWLLPSQGINSIDTAALEKISSETPGTPSATSAPSAAPAAPPLIRPHPLPARRSRHPPAPISVAAANAAPPKRPVSSPVSIPAKPKPESESEPESEPTSSGPPAPLCAGFVIAPASTDPFALVHCPRPPILPPVLCRACQADKAKRGTQEVKAGCGGARYCAAHWCGGCKRLARRVAAAERAAG